MMSLHIKGEIINLNNISNPSYLRRNKAANLHKISQQGFNIPHTYFINFFSIDKIIPELTGSDSSTDINRLEKIIACGIDTLLISNIIDVLKQFKNDAPYISAILRSSAHIEDCKDMSFAGIYKSEFISCDIEINELRHIFAKLLCAPLHSSAKEYLSKMKTSNKDKDIFDISLILQNVINGSPSGVMFTQNPISNDNNIIIESTIGLNTTVTSGKITPDYYEINRKNGYIVKKEIGHKKIMAMIVDGKLCEENTPENYQLNYSLSQYHINELLKNAIKLEDLFGDVQDIEWIFDNDILYILQSRPIVKKEG